MIRTDLRVSDQWTFEPAPCETCPLVARCKRRLEACGQFASFVSYGGRRWRSESREPSSEIFAKIYRDGSAEELLAA
jgi:hypothetical protein